MQVLHGFHRGCNAAELCHSRCVAVVRSPMALLSRSRGAELEQALAVGHQHSEQLHPWGCLLPASLGWLPCCHTEAGVLIS